MAGGFLGSLLEILLVSLSTSLMLLMMMLGYVIFIGLWFTKYWHLSLLYSIWWYYDRNPYLSTRRLSFLRQLSGWQYLVRYFSAKLYKTAELDPSKNFLFAVHPHGMPCFGGLINFGTNATNFDETFPGITVHPLTHGMQYNVPFLRDFLIAGGGRPVSEESIRHLLTTRGPGHSVLIAIGGAAEMTLCDPDSYILKLKNRKGFIRMALETGSVVVPVFIFNESRLYDTPAPKKGSVFDYLTRFSRLFTNSAPPLDVRGRWWWAGMFVPKKLPLNTVVGKPLDFGLLKSVHKGDPISQELLTECHEIYKDELTKLYNEYKGRFGDEDTPLIFV